MNPYDIVAVVLVGIAHIVVFVESIHYRRLSHTMVAMLGIVFTILLGVVVVVTGYPEFNTILLLLFLLSLGLMKEGLPVTRNLYFALMSMVGITFVRMALIELGFWLFMQSPLNLYLWTGSLIHCIVSVIIFAAVLLLRKQIRSVADFLLGSPLYIITYILLCIGFSLELILTTPSSALLAGIHETYGQASYIAAYILFFILLLIVMVSLHLSKEHAVDRERARSDRELLAYVGKLEHLHEELAGFRHDYANVLLSLEEGIRQGDITQIEHVYYSVIAPTSRLTDNGELVVTKLSRVQVPEVKSVLIVKTLDALQRGLQVGIDIPKDVCAIPMPAVSFVRALSILLDNAIDEAALTEEKLVQIALFETEASCFFIVRNSCHEQTIDLKKMYTERYSSKGKGRGYGLLSLKRIVDKTDNASLETDVQYPFFTQTLMLKKEPLTMKS